jgi:hypothetical protein
MWTKQSDKDPNVHYRQVFVKAVDDLDQKVNQMRNIIKDASREYQIAKSFVGKTDEPAQYEATLDDVWGKIQHISGILEDIQNEGIYYLKM